jgi:hypothetical protein
MGSQTSSERIAFHPLTMLEEVMKSVRRIEGDRKVFRISFMVYWRHYG